MGGCSEKVLIGISDNLCSIVSREKIRLYLFTKNYFLIHLSLLGDN